MQAFIGVFYPARQIVRGYQLEQTGNDVLVALDALSDPGFWKQSLGGEEIDADDLLNRCMGAAVFSLSREHLPTFDLLMQAIVYLSDVRYQWLDVSLLPAEQPGETRIDIRSHLLRARSAQHAAMLFSQEPRVSLGLQRTWVTEKPFAPVITPSATIIDIKAAPALTTA